MIPIISKQFWNRRLSLLAYCLIGLALLWMYVALFPSIQASAVQLQKLIESYPKSLYQALGIQDLSFDTIEKFLSVEMFSLMWPLLAITFALSRAGGAIAGEIEKGTMGLYLALPVSRVKLYLSKYLGELASLVTFTVVTVLGVIPLIAVYHESASLSILFKLALLSLLFIWALFAAAFALSAAFSERGKVYMIMGGVLVLMYVANVIASLKTSLDGLHNGSVFYFYNAQDVLSRNDLRLSSIAVFVSIIVIGTAFGAWLFNRRDVMN